MGSKLGKEKKEKQWTFPQIKNVQELHTLPRDSDKSLWVFDKQHQKSIETAISERKCPSVFATIICEFLDNRMDGYFRICHSAVNDYINNGNVVWCQQWSEDHERRPTRILFTSRANVGKSTLVLRYITGQWFETCDPTIEDNYRKQVHVKGFAYTMTLDILDVAGSRGEEYSFLKDEWFRGRQVIVCCFRMDDPGSLDQCAADLQLWKRLNGDNVGNTGVVMVACQMDLVCNGSGEVKDEVVETMQRAKELSSTWNIPLIGTSAKKDINVNALFVQIMYEYWLQTQTDSVCWNKI